MSTPDELAALSTAMESSTPWLIGLALSWAAYGGSLVQIAVLLGARKSTESGWRKAALSVIFGLATVDSVLNLKSAISLLVDVYGDLDKFLIYLPEPYAIMLPFLEMGILFLCQVFLMHRSLAFARSFYGRLPLLRWVLMAGLLVLACAAYITGSMSQAITLEIGDLVTIQEEASDADQVVFETLRATWLSSSLAVDIGLAVAITIDLCRAMSFGANDVGVGANVRLILAQLVAFSAVNGLFLVAFQLTFLVVILLENFAWTDVALIFLPQLQLLSVLLLVNLPRSTARYQASVDVDSHRAPLSNGLPAPAASRPPRSPLQRGRRKLAPLVGKFSSRGSRSSRPTGSCPSRSLEASPGPWASTTSVEARDGPLDLFEMLEMTTATRSAAADR